MTQKELIQKHRDGLNAQFERDYPKGRFVLQIRDKNSQSKKLPQDILNPDIRINLAWERRRRTSHTAPGGVCVTNRGDSYGNIPLHKRVVNGLLVESWLNNTWGYVRYFSSMEDMLEYAKSLGVPELQMETFKQLLKDF